MCVREPASARYAVTVGIVTSADVLSAKGGPRIGPHFLFGGGCFFNLIDVDGRVVLSDQISLGSLGVCLGSCLDRLGCLDAALVVWVVWVVWVVCVLVLENTLQSN